jgi:hypothetical protein
LTLSLSSGAGNYQDINAWWASASPPTAHGTPLTNDPVQPTNFRLFSNKQLVPSPVANCKYHMIYSDAGDVLQWISEDGSGWAAHVQGSLETKNFDTGDKYPWQGWMGYLDAAKGSFIIGNSFSANHIACFNISDAVLSSNVCGLAYPYAFGAAMLAFDSNGSDISTEFPSYPAWLVSRSGFVANRGVLVDITLAPYGTGVAQGTEEPGAPTTSTTAILGEFWVPNGGATPTY